MLRSSCPSKEKRMVCRGRAEARLVCCTGFVQVGLGGCIGGLFLVLGLLALQVSVLLRREDERCNREVGNDRDCAAESARVGVADGWPGWQLVEV